MTATIECPACKAVIDAEARTCPHCDYNLAEQTQVFDPLELSGSAVDLASSAQGTPQLTLVKGSSKGSVFYLESFPITVGRDPICDIFLNDRTVSRQHAIIEQIGSKIVVRDNHSLNGTWVDNKVVEQTELQDGSLLQIGTFTMRFNC